MKKENEDALWNLLGNASHQKGSPFFSRKVLRAIAEEKRSPSIFRVISWLIPTSACAALALGWFAYQQHEQQAQMNAYFDTAADLQSLVAQEDMSSWGDSGN